MLCELAKQQWKKKYYGDKTIKNGFKNIIGTFRDKDSS